MGACISSFSLIKFKHMVVLNLIILEKNTTIDVFLFFIFLFYILIIVFIFKKKFLHYCINKIKTVDYILSNNYFKKTGDFLNPCYKIIYELRMMS